MLSKTHMEVLEKLMDTSDTITKSLEFAKTNNVHLKSLELAAHYFACALKELAKNIEINDRLH